MVGCMRRDVQKQRRNGVKNDKVQHYSGLPECGG